MTIRIDQRNGRHRYDVIVMGPSGRVRERRNFPESLRTETQRLHWVHAREAYLTRNGEQPEETPAPTLLSFSRRWMEEYSRANGNKPSTIAAKETILRLHLCPVLGSRRLDAIGDVDVQRVRLHLRAGGRSTKTVACVLGVLATLLRTAERWNVIAKAPHIGLPSVPDAGMEFYDTAEWEALVGGAKRAGPMVFAAVLLGGDAGLRRGELEALEQADIRNGVVSVVRSAWNGEVGTTKSGRSRRIPLTSRLKDAVDAIRHLRGRRLLWQASGAPVKVTTLQSWLEVACKRAGLPPSRNLHKLRHTFISHLAMNGVPVKTIQELAGHADLKTTMRYMHLSKGSAEAAIATLGHGARVEQQCNDGRL